LLAYNRGEQKTARDLKLLFNEQNKRCSICALTADRSKLDETFQSEKRLYVPRFFAAASSAKIRRRSACQCSRYQPIKSRLVYTHARITRTPARRLR